MEPNTPEQVANPLPPDEPAYSEDGVDLTLIRWFLGLTPIERLRFLQRHANAVLRIRRANPQL